MIRQDSPLDLAIGCLTIVLLFVLMFVLIPVIVK